MLIRFDTYELGIAGMLRMLKNETNARSQLNIEVWMEFNRSQWRAFAGGRRLIMSHLWLL